MHDSTTKEDYLVLEAGGKRPILPGAFTGSNYEELLHGAPPPEGAGRRIALTVASLTLLGVLCYLLLSWRRRVKPRA